MKTGTAYRRAKQAAWRTIADETVVLDLKGKRMYGLNPAAARIWQVLDEATAIDELARLISVDEQSTFGDPEIADFLGELVALGLAQELTPTPASGAQRSDGVEPPADCEPEALEPPAILWQEEVEQIAGTCAFFPSQNPLCNQVPFS